MRTKTTPAAGTTDTADTADTAGSEPAIRLAGVTKSYPSRDGDVLAVRSLDLTIEEGEFFSLLGPSGCGKTTTMRMIAGFEQPTTGVVWLHGDDVTSTAPNKRDVNMVFQSYALFPHMTVFDNVSFGLRRRRVASAEITSRVTEMLELVELSSQHNRRPAQLSGGQQQRVALARALVNRPRALLLDEPLGALDLKLRQSMQTELKRIQREVGITFVYVTHDQGEALTMSDRIAVMNAGAVEQLGAPAEIYERPASRFVAGFIGTSNLLTGAVEAIEDEFAVIRPDADQRILVRVAAADTAVGKRLDVTVRPEKIRLVDDSDDTEAPADDLCRLRGEITDVSYLGTATHYDVRTTIGAEISVFVQNSSDSRDIARPGDSVWLCWRPEHSYALGEPA